MPPLPPRRIRLWPVGLVGRVSMVLLAAVVLVFIASAVFYEEAETYIDDDARIAQLGEALSTDLRVMDMTPVTQRPVLAVLLSDSGLTITWHPAGQPEAGTPVYPLRRLEQNLVALDRVLGNAGLQIYAQPTSSTSVRGMLRMSDGSRLDFVAPNILRHRHVTRGLASAAITAGAVAIAAAMLVRALSTPLRALAEVADGVTGEGDWVPLDERGPKEVRGLARAINAMQIRIQRLITDRTEVLAAVSHDLRTPLARLRLRVGFLADAEAQTAIESDIEEMEAMVTGVLAYLAGDLDPEPPRMIDLAAMLMTLLESHHDRGRDTAYNGPDRCLIEARPLATKRVFANLIDNACHYGGSAYVTAKKAQGQVTIVVEDSGPGIPESEYDRVLTPFYRLEGSRSRRTGGLGLGLAIVKREVERANGSVALGRAPQGGLSVRVVLPVKSAIKTGLVG
ncbi:two component sensor histidine kinase [Neoasaia chiangmaiensis NBRC 101099]|uniref:histidine kinase n=1 Tax=Neoasaia chiangmaiensis TaxID=320497 RepID=A0A1U9KPV6_9PROT|nr:ATP-binding protein [Neoasaia chiangmaiensis]AQS87852.1 two-component sensor histidine kinase [Neoasaia chiangmaiensis]GBR35859.1 two component sensor histidine kinase [Neoasaia chiangmaiensis NBRC 101099]GEN14473.1 hypothetical protein NCH01_09040 [Neoasaia chiangmaiensis]